MADSGSYNYALAAKAQAKRVAKAKAKGGAKTCSSAGTTASSGKPKTLSDLAALGSTGSGSLTGGGSGPAAAPKSAAAAAILAANEKAPRGAAEALQEQKMMRASFKNSLKKKSSLESTGSLGSTLGAPLEPLSEAAEWAEETAILKDADGKDGDADGKKGGGDEFDELWDELEEQEGSREDAESGKGKSPSPAKARGTLHKKPEEATATGTVEPVAEESGDDEQDPSPKTKESSPKKSSEASPKKSEVEEPSADDRPLGATATFQKFDVDDSESSSSEDESEDDEPVKTPAPTTPAVPEGSEKKEDADVSDDDEESSVDSGGDGKIQVFKPPPRAAAKQAAAPVAKAAPAVSQDPEESNKSEDGSKDETKKPQEPDTAPEAPKPSPKPAQSVPEAKSVEPEPKPAPVATMPVPTAKAADPAVDAKPKSADTGPPTKQDASGAAGLLAAFQEGIDQIEKEQGGDTEPSAKKAGIDGDELTFSSLGNAAPAVGAKTRVTPSPEQKAPAAAATSTRAAHEEAEAKRFASAGVANVLNKGADAGNKEFVVSSGAIAGAGSKKKQNNLMTKPDTIDEAIKRRVQAQSGAGAGAAKKRSSAALRGGGGATAAGAGGVNLFAQYRNAGAGEELLKDFHKDKAQADAKKKASDEAAAKASGNASDSTAAGGGGPKDCGATSSGQTSKASTPPKKGAGAAQGPRITSEVQPSKEKTVEEREAEEQAMWDQLGSEEVQAEQRRQAEELAKGKIVAQGAHSNITYRQFVRECVLPLGRTDGGGELLVEPDDLLEPGSAAGAGGGGGGCLACLGGGGGGAVESPPRASSAKAAGKNPRLQTEMRALRKLIRKKYSPQEELGFRAISTIYRRLTRSGGSGKAGSAPATAVLSIGSHWDVIGFQGTNPETDLNRFGGLCNLLHVLHFLLGPGYAFIGGESAAVDANGAAGGGSSAAGFGGGFSNTGAAGGQGEANTDSSCCFEVADRVYQLSRLEGSGQDFPFLTVSINFSKLALDILFSGKGQQCENPRWSRARSKLVRAIKQQQEAGQGSPVIDTVAKLQSALLYAFGEIWRHERRSIGQFDQTLKEIEKKAEKDLTSLLTDYEAELRRAKDRKTGAGLQFSDIGGGGGGGASSKAASGAAASKRMQKYAEVG